MTEPIPINCPPRSELWRRVQLALSILGHRIVLPTSTADLLISVLRGDTDLRESKDTFRMRLPSETPGESVAVPDPKEAS